VKHLIASPPRQQACSRPKLPAYRFDASLWKRGALQSPPAAQFRPAALAERLRQNFRSAQTGWALRLPKERRSPGPYWVEHLIALPPRQQACSRPKLPAYRFDASLWKRGALQTPAAAQFQPAALVELFRKSVQAAAQTRRRTFWTERGRGIQVAPLAPGQSNPRVALDRWAFWRRSRRQNGPPRCTIPIRICSHWRIAHERHRPRDIAQHSPVGSTSGSSALLGGSCSIEPFLSCAETFEARSGCRKIDVLPFRIEAGRAQPVDVAEKLVNKSRHAMITR
jgi:hypothetical protein